MNSATECEPCSTTSYPSTKAHPIFLQIKPSESHERAHSQDTKSLINQGKNPNSKILSETTTNTGSIWRFRQCWPSCSTRTKSNGGMGFTSFFSTPWELPGDTSLGSRKTYLLPQVRTVTKMPIWSRKNNLKQQCPTTLLTRRQANLSANPTTATDFLDDAHCYAYWICRRRQISKGLLVVFEMP